MQKGPGGVGTGAAAATGAGRTGLPGIVGEGAFFPAAESQTARSRPGWGRSQSPLSLPTLGAPDTSQGGGSSAVVPRVLYPRWACQFLGVFHLCSHQPLLSACHRWGSEKGTDLCRVMENMHCGAGYNPEVPASRRLQWPDSSPEELGAGSQAPPLSRGSLLKPSGLSTLLVQSCSPHPLSPGLPR